MNNKLFDRCSIRKFDKYNLTSDELKTFINIINSSPTSINGQAFSAIIVNDQELKNKLSQLGSFQKHISDCSIFVLFNMDLTSTIESFKTKESEINKELIPNIILTSIVDATISATMLQDYAVLNNFGTCWIGAIRHDLNKVRQLLGLNDKIFPLFGLCIGKTSIEQKAKPKLNKVFLNGYNQNELEQRIKEYDVTLDEYYKTKYPNFPSKGFYKQVQSFYAKDSKYLAEFDNDELLKILDKDYIYQIIKDALK